MNKPSRNMPKFKPRKPSKLVVIAVFLVFSACIYVEPVLLIGLLGIVALSIVYGYFESPKNDRHFAELRNNRESLSICDFAREFEKPNIDTWVIRATYEQIQSYLGKNNSIPIKATDRLEEDLLIHEEDLSLDLAEEIAQRTGRSFENQESNPFYGKVKTVSDLVNFFNCQARTNAT